MRRHFEVVVVGSGPAGASTAINLLRAGVTVSIVASEDTRSSLPGEALSPEVRAEFRRMGLEGDFPREAMPSYGIEALWGQEIPVFHSHLCSPGGNGLLVTRPEFHGALLRAALASGDCGFFSGHFLRAEKTSRGWAVTIRIRETTKTVTCDLLVDATGRTAAVARHLGARRRRLDSLCGISSVFDFPSGQQMLLVEATSYGWWFLTPINRSQTLVCLMSDVDLLQHLSAFRSNNFLCLLEELRFLSSRLGVLPTEVLTRVHPCETGTLDRLAGDGWIAVGDAASIVDPLSSTGVLKALKSGSDAAETVSEHLGGHPFAFRHYEQRNRNEFQTYLKTRQRQYSIERRWSRETFWTRRLSPSVQAQILRKGSQIPHYSPATPAV
jgi:flavin-dependent dehydrogenase